MIALPRRWVTTALRVGAGLALPSVAFYVLRLAGVGLYLSLVVSTLVSAVPALVDLVRGQRPSGLSTYVTAMTLGGLVVTLVPGSTRFLLARESIMTGVTGVWFLASGVTTRTRGARPLAYLFTRPLIEGRWRWPDHWEQLWEVSPRFARMWRVSSALFGVGLLLDAALRVVLVYTVRPDLVPALGLALYVVTLIVLNVVVNTYYVRCGVFDPRSPLRRGAVPADAGP
jgi:hypothetical protein